mmetsp:Transcript_17271/g.19688  ORF Transcript_17271/g.19688 Transcript_17271/m.19688 type:complete len:581 (+) Transcript_17271:26-1768(+)
MLSVSRALLKTSAVVVSPAGAAQAYQNRYRMLKAMTLSRSFNEVSEENRYTSLRILLERLSGHVGRRQYKIHASLERHLDTLKAHKLDWHDVKALPLDDVLDLLGDGLLKLSHQERVVLMSAWSAKVCGVLKKGTEVRHSETLCMRTGLSEHGWRCGKQGHVADVYFEGKQKRNSLALATELRPSAVRWRDTRLGAQVEVRPEPDFSIVGRLQHETNPRIWSTPSNATFDVSVIGIEFRVHPDDPRAEPQIEAAANEWRQHAEVVRHVLWEMLELYGVEREPQSLSMKAGELGEPDEINAFTAAFTRYKSRQTDPSSAGDSNSESTRILEEDVVVEQRMASNSKSSSSSTSDDSASSTPWFLPPLPQQFSEQGVPACLPFAPSFVVRGTFQAIDRTLHNDDDSFSRALMQPVMRIECFVHPAACYWLNPEDEAKCMGHVTAFASKIPFAVPFNLYLRIDPSRILRGDSGAVFAKKRDDMMAAKAHWFDYASFRETARHSGFEGARGWTHPDDASSSRSNADEQTIVHDVDLEHSEDTSQNRREHAHTDDKASSAGKGNYSNRAPPKGDAADEDWNPIGWF